MKPPKAKTTAAAKTAKATARKAPAPAKPAAAKPLAKAAPPPAPAPAANPFEAAAVWEDIGKLKAWAANPRDNADAIAQVAASIKRFGFSSPIIARRADGEVIAGHTRLEAARRLGLRTVPVRYMNLDPAEAHLLAIADNKLGEIAAWKAPELAAELSKFSLEDAAFAGFDQKALDKLASGVMRALDTVDAAEGDDEERIEALDTPSGFTHGSEEATEVFNNAAIKQVVLYFEADRYADVIAQFETIRSNNQLASNTDVVLWLLRQFAESNQAA